MFCEQITKCRSLSLKIVKVFLACTDLLMTIPSLICKNQVEFPKHSYHRDLLQLIFLLFFIARTPFHNLLVVLHQRVTLERCSFKITLPPPQTWNLSKNLHRRIFRLKILHHQFHLISTVLVGKNTKNEWKWRNLHRWQKFYTAAGSDKFHLC